MDVFIFSLKISIIFLEVVLKIFFSCDSAMLGHSGHAVVVELGSSGDKLFCYCLYFYAGV